MESTSRPGHASEASSFESASQIQVACEIRNNSIVIMLTSR
jgi:hypothetical protein